MNTERSIWETVLSWVHARLVSNWFSNTEPNWTGKWQVQNETEPVGSNRYRYNDLYWTILAWPIYGHNPPIYRYEYQTKPNWPVQNETEQIRLVVNYTYRTDISVSLGLAQTCQPNWPQQAPAQIPTCPKATPAFRYVSVCVSVCLE